MGEWKPPMIVTSADLSARARSYVLRIASPGERTEQKKPSSLPIEDVRVAHQCDRGLASGASATPQRYRRVRRSCPLARNHDQVIASRPSHASACLLVQRLP